MHLESRLMSEKPAHIYKSNHLGNPTKWLHKVYFTIFWYKLPNGYSSKRRPHSRCLDLPQQPSIDKWWIYCHTGYVTYMFIEPGYQHFNLATSVGILATWPNQIGAENLSVLKKQWDKHVDGTVTTYSILYCILEVSGLGDRCDWIVFVYPGRHRSNSLRLLP